MAIARSTMIGVFDDIASAENAMEALHNAGFSGDQIKYSGHAATSSGFWEGIKNLFTGTTGNSSEHVVKDLMDLGLPQEEASYYAVQHQNGHPIVAVKADDRVQEAAQILQNNGGSSYRAGIGSTVASTYGQSTYQQGNQYNQPINPQGDRYSESVNTPADQYNRETYPQGDQYGQQRNYSQPDQYSQSTNQQADTYNQPINPQGDRYSESVNTPANQYNQPPRTAADQYNQASPSQANQYNQPPRAPADQYDQQAYSQGTQYDPNTETEEHRQARLREERLRAERQYGQSQSQSQSDVAPTRDTYADDERNGR